MPMPGVTGPGPERNTSDEGMVAAEHPDKRMTDQLLVMNTNALRDNNPYRGTQNHGVPHYWPSPADVDMVTDEDEFKTEYWSRLGITRYYEPVPVRIVRDDERACAFSTRLYPVTSVMSMAVGRRPKRASLTVINKDLANIIYISDDPSSLLTFCYYLSPGETLTFENTNAEVYAGCAAGIGPINLGIIEEYYPMESL